MFIFIFTSICACTFATLGTENNSKHSLEFVELKLKYDQMKKTSIVFQSKIV